jgi:hypothetical protein
MCDSSTRDLHLVTTPLSWYASLTTQHSLNGRHVSTELGDARVPSSYDSEMTGRGGRIVMKPSGRHGRLRIETQLFPRCRLRCLSGSLPPVSLRPNPCIQS